MRQFRVWCPEFSETENDGPIYDVQIMYDAVEQYLEDHADGEDEAAAARGYEFKIHARRIGHTSDGDLFPIITYSMTGDYGFVWSGDVSDDCPQEGDSGLNANQEVGDGGSGGISADEKVVA